MAAQQTFCNMSSRRTAKRYERVRPYSKALSRTFVCTTNDQRKIVLAYRKFNEEAFRIIMGMDGDK